MLDNWLMFFLEFKLAKARFTDSLLRTRSNSIYSDWKFKLVKRLESNFITFAFQMVSPSHLSFIDLCNLKGDLHWQRNLASIYAWQLGPDAPLWLCPTAVILFLKHFFKPFKNRVKYCSQGDWSPFFDFDHLPKEIELFYWLHIFRLVERIIFKKEIVQIGPSIPYRFCKIGLKNTLFCLFIFGRKVSVCFVLFCLLQYFVQFRLTIFFKL